MSPSPQQQQQKTRNREMELYSALRGASIRLENLYYRIESREAMSMSSISCIHCEEMIRFCSNLVRRKDALEKSNFLPDIRSFLTKLRMVTHLMRDHRHIEVNGFTNSRWNGIIKSINDCCTSNDTVVVDVDKVVLTVDDDDDDGGENENNVKLLNDPPLPPQQDPPPPRRITLLNETGGRQQSTLQFEDVEEWSMSSVVTEASWWLAIRSVFTDVQHYRRKRVVINQGYSFWRNLYDLPDTENIKAQFFKRALYIEEMANREVRLAGLTMVILIAGSNLIISNYSVKSFM